MSCFDLYLQSRITQPALPSLMQPIPTIRNAFVYARAQCQLDLN
jgi:hypothetical protein